MALSLPDYRQHLHGQNSSFHVFNFVQQKIGSEVIMDIACQFTKESLKIPVRHSNIANIRCIYELENWLDYYQSKEDKIQGFNCPGCKGFTKFLDFGVDYSLLNVLATIKQFKLEDKIAQKKIGLTIGNQYKYHAYANPIKDKKKINIPGTSSMMGINRNNQKQQIQLSMTQQVIQEDSSYTIMKMQQYLLQKKYKSGKKQIQQLSQIAKLVSDDYLQNTWLNRLGQKSLKNDIVFAFKKIQRGKDNASLLVVYFVHYAIWVDYELLDSSNQNYVQKENAFYLKESNNQCHQIYIVGGKTGPYEQNKQFSRIDVPLDPFVVQKKLKVVNLVEIPREGYNFMGGIHNGKIYIFYGQRRYVNSQNCIQDELLNSSWRYSNGKWEDIKKKLLPRYDGSSFIVEQTAFGKIMIFYGGLTRQPDGLAQPNCQQQTKAQIFLFDEEKFLGNQSEEFPGFDVNFIGTDPNQFRSLCTPILSVPYYNGVQLLLSGEFLKHQLTGKRQIFDFNYSKGQVKLNVIFSFEPPEYALTPYQNRTSSGVEIFTPIHDSCGAILFGQYYSILQVEDPSNKNRGTTTSLIKINLTNGQVKLVEYEDSKSTQDRAKQYLQTLPASQKNEFEYTIKANEIPIRHNTTAIQCVFGFDLSIDFEKPKILCQVCNKEFEKYGVDYQLYNDISKLTRIHQIGNKVLLRYIVKDGLILLCTTQPISVEHRSLHLDAKSRLSLNDKSLSILQEAQDILFELYDYYIKKYKEKSTITHQALLKQQRSKILLANIKDVLQLKQLSKSTIDSIFTFTLIKKNQKTYLIVYYIEYQVWKEFELKLNEQPLDIYDLALYLKDVPLKKNLQKDVQKEEQKKFNYIYSLGGRQSELCPSTRFVRIKFPANPYTNIQAIVDNLPPLPKPTERLLGGIYENKVFIFNGSTRTNVDGRIREDFTQLSHYFDNQWKQLDISLCQRYCGSIYNYQSKYGYVGALIGGIQRVPDGRAIKYCEFQENIEFFNYETQKFLGSVKLNYHPQNTKELFTGEMLIIPSKYADTCDFITGQCLDNKKHSLDLAKNVLKQINDYTTQFGVLYVEETVNNKRSIFQNFMDYQGQFYNGRFYVMAKKPQEICSVFQINPKSGQVEELNNNQTNQQYEKKKEQYEKLSD